MNRYLVEFKQRSPVSGKQMTNKRVVYASHVDKVVVEFVAMGYSEDSIIRVWAEVLTRHKAIRYSDLRKLD